MGKLIRMTVIAAAIIALSSCGNKEDQAQRDEAAKQAIQQGMQKDKALMSSSRFQKGHSAQYMFEQMGVSAPLAGLVIFILLFVFFRRFKVIIAPMILAILAITWTMTLLIGSGTRALCSHYCENFEDILKIIL